MARKKEEVIELCNHVKANGTCCDSPALKDESYCFFHKSVRERTKRLRRAARLKLPLQLPVLEDGETIQLAIGDVLNALLAGQIDHKTAGLLLYGLQTAAGNAKDLHFETFRSDRVYEQYHNEEEESLEAEIEEEIEEEQKTAQQPEVAAEATPEEEKRIPLPPKKAPQPATEAELLDTACKLAMTEARAIVNKVKKEG
jgi:hypothetical protein